MLTPLSADLFSVVNAGANIEQLLLLTINDMNDVPNAPRATTLTPQGPGRQRGFPPRHPDPRFAPRSRGHRAGDRDQRAIRFDVRPDPRGLGGRRDVIDAAKEGYVFRSQGHDRMALLKRDKDLFLKIRPQYVHSPEMEEVARIFRLTPGLSQYRIKSELSDEVTGRSPRPAGE